MGATQDWGTRADRESGTPEADRAREIARLETAWAEAARPPRSDHARVAKVLGIAWLLVFAALGAFPEPEGAAPGWVIGLQIAFTLGFAAAVGGLLSGRRWASNASLIVASVGVVAGILCAATDHHGLWWATLETGMFAGLVIGSVVVAKAFSERA